jgi:hypothetical protein
LEGLSQEERSKLIRSVGTHRGDRPLSPIEVGRLFERAIQHNPIGRVVEWVDFRDPTMIMRFVGLLGLPDQFQALVDWGSQPGGIPFSAAALVSGLPKEMQTELLTKIVNEELGTSDVKLIVPIIRKGRSVEDAIAEAGKLRPVIVRRHILIGAVGTSSRTAIEGLEQPERDALLRKVVERTVRPSDLATVRLLPERFTLVTNDDGKSAIDLVSTRAGVSFERFFQDLIGRELEVQA